MTQPTAPVRFRFGPFEVDPVTGELRRSGIRLRLAGQPFRILMALLARPGELVTREQLRDEVWSDSTFVDFEHGLNAAVNKLRRALGDAAESPQYIETHTGRGYRFIGTLHPPEVLPAPVIEPLPAVVLPRRTHPSWRWVAIVVVCVLIAVSGWRLHEKTVAPPPPWQVNRLTSDAGLSNSSALSRDGKLIAYSSDRAHDGEMDLYVTHLSGGPPIRLTMDGTNNTAPDFSPDGTRLVFHSNRAGGGIYEVAAFGGEARLLVDRGLDPKYSPDGSEVAYWVGDPYVAQTVPGGGEVWVVSAAGGEPRRVGAQFTNARFPIWAPDGNHLLLVGYTGQKSAENTAIDWWIVATHGDTAVRTDMYAALTQGGLASQKIPATPNSTFPHVPTAACWQAATNSVIFSAPTGETRSLWEINLAAATNKVRGPFKRLTAGAGDETGPSCAAGEIVAFTSGENRSAIWSIRTDLNRGRIDGKPELLTQGSTDREPSLSGDGRYIAFSSARSGALNVWTREQATGKEVRLAPSSNAQRYALMDGAGNRLAYSLFEQDGTRSIYLWTRDQPTKKLCGNCLRATGWTPDQKKVLIFAGNPFAIALVDPATGERTPLVSHKSYNVLSGRFSPDGRWISFTVRLKANRSMIAIAPLDGLKPIPESAWIEIADVGPEDKADWSPDGKTLYFTSARDGHRCLWGQRVDPLSRRPLGDAFAVQHFHGRLSYDPGGWSAAHGQAIFALTEGRENVWIMSRANSDK